MGSRKRGQKVAWKSTLGQDLDRKVPSDRLSDNIREAIELCLETKDQEAW